MPPTPIFTPGEFLGTHFLNDGLDAVVSAGGAVSPDAKTAGRKGDIVKQDDDPLGRDVEIGGKLQYRAAGQVHICLGLEQEELSAVIRGLSVKALEFQLVDLAAKVFSQQIQAAEAGIVAGPLVILAGVAQAYDQPVFT